jgi:hypothetical protein
LPAIFAIENHFMLKRLLLVVLLFAGIATLFAQADTLLVVKDSVIQLQQDSLTTTSTDSLTIADSARFTLPDTLIPKQTRLEALLAEHQYLNTKSKPVAFAMKHRNANDLDALFYVIFGLLFLFAILRAVYKRYFSTLFTVFFNSSLRQSQLTDQLIQAKLPSLLYNFIFVLAGSLYIYLLIQLPFTAVNKLNWWLMGSCVIAMIGVYITKFLTLKFIGWATGYQQESNLYIFVVFLINKVTGIFILPVLVILAFSSPAIAAVMVVLSFVVVGLLFLLRYFRAYGLLQHRIKVSRFHFLLFVFSTEILPLLLIFKAVNVFILKNL